MNIHKSISIISFFMVGLFFGVFLQLHNPEEAMAQERRDLVTVIDESSEAGSDPIIGHLQTRDKMITIRSGKEGPLYTVTSKDGILLAEDLSAKDLQNEFPDLRKIFQNGFALEDACLRNINLNF